MQTTTLQFFDCKSLPSTRSIKEFYLAIPIIKKFCSINLGYNVGLLEVLNISIPTMHQELGSDMRQICGSWGPTVSWNLARALYYYLAPSGPHSNGGLWWCFESLGINVNSDLVLEIPVFPPFQCIVNWINIYSSLSYLNLIHQSAENRQILENDLYYQRLHWVAASLQLLCQLRCYSQPFRSVRSTFVDSTNLGSKIKIKIR